MGGTAVKGEESGVQSFEARPGEAAHTRGDRVVAKTSSLGMPSRVLVDTVPPATAVLASGMVVRLPPCSEQRSGEVLAAATFGMPPPSVRSPLVEADWSRTSGGTVTAPHAVACAAAAAASSFFLLATFSALVSLSTCPTAAAATSPPLTAPPVCLPLQS